LAELHHAFLVTRKAKVPPFAGKGQEIFMTALSAADPGKPIMEQTAVQITIDHILDVRAKETVCPFKTIFIGAFEGLEVVPYALVIR